MLAFFLARLARLRTNAEKRGDARCRAALFAATRVAASMEVRVCALCAFICRLDTRIGLLEDLSLSLLLRELLLIVSR